MKSGLSQGLGLIVGALGIFWIGYKALDVEFLRPFAITSLILGGAVLVPIIGMIIFLRL
jgi:hypothetical protein